MYTRHINLFLKTAYTRILLRDSFWKRKKKLFLKYNQIQIPTHAKLQATSKTIYNQQLKCVLRLTYFGFKTAYNLIYTCYKFTNNTQENKMLTFANQNPSIWEGKRERERERGAPKGWVIAVATATESPLVPKWLKTVEGDAAQLCLSPFPLVVPEHTFFLFFFLKFQQTQKSHLYKCKKTNHGHVKISRKIKPLLNYMELHAKGSQKQNQA